jgi:hypothetical protein
MVISRPSQAAPSQRQLDQFSGGHVAWRGLTPPQPIGLIRDRRLKTRAMHSGANQDDA